MKGFGWVAALIVVIPFGVWLAASACEAVPPPDAETADTRQTDRHVRVLWVESPTGDRIPCIIYINHGISCDWTYREF